MIAANSEAPRTKIRGASDSRAEPEATAGRQLTRLGQAERGLELRISWPWK
jgi:hypothetical protein